MASSGRHPASRSLRRALPVLGVTLIAGGLSLLAVLAWAIWSPPPSPFSYRMVAEGKAGAFPKLKLDASVKLKIRKYEIRVEDVDKPVADFHAAYNGDADPVLLEWRNHLTEPVLTLGSTLSETTALAKAITKHAPSDALVLGWWDTSRRLKLLSPAKTLFNTNLTNPVLIPPMWEDRRKMIEAGERRFWNVPAGKPASSAFDVFTGALLMEPKAGAARLRKLAAGREVFIAVHITDAYRLGALAPEQFAIGYKDFASAAKIHGMVKHVKEWVKRQGYSAYAVLPQGDEVRRVFFLTDTRSTKTLMAQMLPFNTSNPFEVKALQLVFQHGGYWVYKLSAASARTAQK